MQRVSRYDKEGAEAIFDEITRKASGVFLWVVLVVRSLVAGLRHGDNLTQLRARLGSLPADLERLFDIILDRIQPEFRVESSKIFQIHRASNDQLDAVELYRMLLYQDYESLISMGIEPDTESRSPDVEEMLEIIEEQMSLKLSSRCQGLLEICASNSDPTTYSLSPGLGLGLTDAFTTSRRLRVEYLHRTARDFVEQPDRWLRVTQHTIGIGFDPHAARLLGYVAGAKSTRFSDVPRDGHRILEDIRKLPLSASPETVALMDELDRVLTYRWNEQEGHLHWSCYGSDRNRWQPFESPEHMWPIWGADIVSPAAVQHRLVWFAEAKVGRPGEARSSETASLTTPRLPFLAYAVSLHLWAASSHLPMPDLDLLSLLLGRGYDPNVEFHDVPIWMHVINHVHSLEYAEYVSPGHLLAWAHVFEVMLQAGADPHASCISDPVVVAQTVGYSNDPQDVPPAIIKHFDPTLCEHFTSQHTIDVVVASVFDANDIDTVQLKTTLEAARRKKDPNAKPPEINTPPAPDISTHAKRKSRDADDLVIRKRQRASLAWIE